MNRCQCGHLIIAHYDFHNRQCLESGCECNEFRKEVKV